MLPSSSLQWPLDHTDPWQVPHPPGGVAPLRHDLALGCYLEKRAAYAMPGIHEVGVWRALLRLWTAMTSRRWLASPGSLLSRRVAP